MEKTATALGLARSVSEGIAKKIFVSWWHDTIVQNDAQIDVRFGY